MTVLFTVVAAVLPDVPKGFAFPAMPILFYRGCGLGGAEPLYVGIE